MSYATAIESPWLDRVLEAIAWRLVLEAFMRLIAKLKGRKAAGKPAKDEPYFTPKPTFVPRHPGQDMSFGVSDGGIW